VAITKSDGAMIERRYFDAWGNLRVLENSAGQKITDMQQLMTYDYFLDRGYTGHEHLWRAGLINMNARLYDPILRKFLSVDNVIQDPYNTQNYDRYSYVLNNPLLYMDVSGNELFVGTAILIGLAVGIFAKGIANMISGIPFWYGIGKSGLMGAISGAISFGIGTAALNTFGTGISIGKAVFEAAAHAITSGVMDAIQGNFGGSGFVSGLISSLIATGIQGLGELGGAFQSIDASQGIGILTNFGDRNPDLLKAIMIASGGLSGGISATIAGGKFIDGFKQGLITSGLNHLAHTTMSGQKEEFTINGKTYDHEGLKEFYATVIGETSNNIQEAQGIGEVILNRIDNQRTNLTTGFVDKIGGIGDFDAIGGKIYNEIMKMKLMDIVGMKPENIYYKRSVGASMALSNWWHLKPGITNGAFFWNATWQKDKSNVGFNWRKYNQGIYQISAEFGQTTFFKSFPSDKN